MGIIFPKKRSSVFKAFIALLLLTFSPIIIVAVLLYFLWGAILYLAIWLTWKKHFVIFVYSNSPTWKDFIEREILPYIQDRAVILNWSERRHWEPSLAVFAFKYFGGQRNFNPIGILFRPFHAVKLYRFFEAFKEFKHGDDKSVEEIKNELFADIRI